MRSRLLSIPVALLAIGVVSTVNASPNPTRLTVDVPSTARVSAHDFVSSARGVLTRHAAIPSYVQLSLAKRSTVGSSRIVRFQQTHQGLPVIGRGAAIAVEPQGNVRLATSRIESTLPASVTPSLSATQAAAVASVSTGLPAGAQHTKLIIWSTPQGGRLAFSVIPPSLLPIPYAPVVVVDAQDGTVLSKTNLVRFKNLANMYEFNPIASPNPTQVTLPIPETVTTPQNDLLVSYNCVDTKTTKLINAMGFDLEMHVCEMQQNAVADGTTGDYTQYEREDDTSGGDPFSQLSIFYHAAKAYDFFKQFDPAFELGVGSKPLFLVANLMMPAGINSFDLDKMKDPNVPLEPFSNAFSAGYDPQMGQFMSMLWPEITGGALFFGQGRNIDYSYDGDVVYHEFGHSMVGATIKLVGTWHLDSQGATAAPGSMNEALADYFSSAITGDPSCGEYAAGESFGDNIRNLENTNTCPKNLAGEVHYDSEFFSAALWAARAGLSSDAERFAFDEALFASLNVASSGYVGFGELAELLVAGVASSSLGQTGADALQAAFESRGVLPDCERVFEWSGAPIRPGATAPRGSFVAAGKSMMPAVLPYAPGLFQVRVPLDDGKPYLGASLTEVSAGGGMAMPGGQSDPFTPAFLVSFDEPITFQTKGGFNSNAGDPVEASKAGSKHSALLEVPDGATHAYVMLVNLGDDDGYFTSLTFDASVEPPDAGPDGSPEEDAGTDAPAVDVDAEVPSDAGMPSEPGPAATPRDSDEGGCGCRAPAGTASGAGAAALMALIGALVARRRRSGTIQR